MSTTPQIGVWNLRLIPSVSTEEYRNVGDICYKVRDVDAVAKRGYLTYYYCMNPSTSTAPLKVVIVEDNTALADIYKTRLELLGYTCFAAYDGEEALAVIQREVPSLVLLDLMVPKVAGDQILAHMRSSEWGKTIKVLIISNLNEADAPAGIREMGIAGYAVKANLANDMLDRFVDSILKPVGQTEDVMLETKGSEAYTPGS